MARPKFEITQEVIDKAEMLASQGMYKDQIADCLGICYDTLNEKSKMYPEFSSALKRGKAAGIALVTQALLNNIQIGNVTAQIYYLKCQAGWREKDDNASEETTSLMQKLIDKL